MAGENPTLTVIVREETGTSTARDLRRDDLLPGVCYGPEIESFPVQLNPEELRDVLDEGGGRNTVFELETDQGQQFEHVMLRDFQFHPVKRELTHVDLFVVTPDRVVEVDVPVEPQGEAEGVHMGGKLQVAEPTVPVRCTPATIPDAIEVDVTDLTPGNAITVFDLEYPEGTESAADTEYAVLRIMMPREGVIGLEPTGPEAEAEEEELTEEELEELEGEEAEAAEEAEEGAEGAAAGPGAAPPGA